MADSIDNSSYKDYSQEIQIYWSEWVVLSRAAFKYKL